MASATALRPPRGRPAQAIALLLLLLAIAAAWLTLVSPLLAWHDVRAADLQQRAALADRMARLAAALPELRRDAAGAAPGAPAPASLLEGATDAIAAATLQERVQSMATAAGAPLSSAEALPATQDGADRQIGLHVTLRAPWPAFVRLLLALDAAEPRMLVDDLALHGVRLPGAPDQPLEASLTVIAFRAAPAATAQAASPAPPQGAAP